MKKEHISYSVHALCERFCLNVEDLTLTGSTVLALYGIIPIENVNDLDLYVPNKLVSNIKLKHSFVEE